MTERRGDVRQGGANTVMADRTAEPRRTRLDSRQLFAGARAVINGHAGQEYRLRLRKR